MAYINIRLGGNTMTKNFWRVRLGAAKKGHNRYERVYNLCKNEKPPCIAVGWGEIEGYDNPGEVWFFNRIDVDWITSPDKYIKVRSLGLPKHTENILLQIPTIINIERNDYNLIKEKMDAYEPEESPSPSKFKREYDTYGKSSR